MQQQDRHHHQQLDTNMNRQAQQWGRGDNEGRDLDLEIPDQPQAPPRCSPASVMQESLRAYIEYHNIVGDDDGGVLMSDEQYQEYKAKALERAQSGNRLYVSWRCISTGMDCRLIGPSSKCFCTHAYRSHSVDTPDKKVFCKVKGCTCKLYEYIPCHGSFRIKCSCKHFFDEHSPAGRKKCLKTGCTCMAFYSPTSCSCGQHWDEHVTVFETRQERMESGRPVDNLGGGGEGYAALGGITNFSSLLDGVDRLDASGIGCISEPPRLCHGSPPSTGAQMPVKLTQEEEFAIYERNLQADKRPPPTHATLVASKPLPQHQSDVTSTSYDAELAKIEANTKLTPAQLYAAKKKLALQHAAELRAARQS
ncbi:protein FAM221A [Pelomyxa schiedti]|nr:protein FAM221A [Pelomyxa schiedti]